MRGLAILVLLAACGPGVSQNDDDDDGGTSYFDGGPPPDSYTGPVGHVSGTVWAPGNAPGMVPAGQEIPVFNALIWVSPSQPAPIPQQAYCDKCVENPGKHTFSDSRGNFTLSNIVPGDYWVAIQKGQFRIERQISIPDTMVALSATDTTLPSEHDPDNGKWIPRIAVATGSYDDLQDILGKMGIGEVDGSGAYVGASAAGARLDFYSNGHWDLDSFGLDTLTWLVSDTSRMQQYHIIFIPCSSTANTNALYTQANLKNIRDFVKAGGKLYVTDWSGEWNDNVFPAQITLMDSGTDTPASAYDPIADSWNTAQFGDADGSSYTSNNAEAEDTDLYAWLDGQVGPTATSMGTNTTPSTFDASSFVVEGNWNTISQLTSVQVGEDEEGIPLFDVPTAFVIGGHDSEIPKRPLTVTYEPSGCGRVLFSTYHTTDDTHVGLVPQERVLLYLIMEIGVCTEGPIID